MNERLSKIWNSPFRQPTLISVVAFGAGTAFGYLWNKRVTENEIQILKAQLAAIKRLQALKRKKEFETVFQKDPKEESVEQKGMETPTRTLPNNSTIEVSPPEDQGKVFVLDNIVKDTSNALVQPEPELVTKSIFSNDNDWNHDLEEKRRQRHPDQPYILHKDEFYAAGNGYHQVTLTYYAGDDIMVDEEDKPIYDHIKVTGELKFGHGSGDPNVVYIRNDKRRAEYEVIRDPGLYSVEVLGLEIEDNQRVKDLKHSNTPGKFRDY